MPVETILLNGQMQRVFRSQDILLNRSRPTPTSSPAGTTGSPSSTPPWSEAAKRSRLTAEELALGLERLTPRPDDTSGVVAVLRFMCRQILAAPTGFFSVYGAAGGGKSVVLSILLAELVRREVTVRYYHAGEIEAALKPSDGGGEFAGDPAAWKRTLKRLPVLAVDEIDKVRWTPWNVEHIGELLDHRYRHAAELLTLFSMNRPPEAWHNADDVTHIASRLRDGRFNALWPEGVAVPPCIARCTVEVDGRRRFFVPGCFEVTLGDIRPILKPGRGR